MGSVRNACSNPKFSVIVNAYNVQGYIDDALASIRAQTFDDFEVILVDDGSTDGTLDALKLFAASRNDTYVVDSGHHGLLLARRMGLAAARGEYIVFLDGDDCLHIDALRRCAEEISRTAADIVIFRYSREQDFSTCWGYDTPAPGLYVDDDYYSEIRQRLCRTEFVSLWGKAYRRSCIDIDADYLPYAGLNHAEDLFQLLPIFDRASSLLCIDDVLYFYRRNPRSLTAMFREDMLTDCERLVTRLRNYAKRWGRGCSSQAYIGERSLYRELLMIANGLPRSERKGAFRKIRTAMLNNGSLKRALLGSCSFRQKLLFKLLEHGFLMTLHCCLDLKRWTVGFEMLHKRGVGRRTQHA